MYLIILIKGRNQRSASIDQPSIYTIETSAASDRRIDVAPQQQIQIISLNFRKFINNQ